MEAGLRARRRGHSSFGGRPAPGSSERPLSDCYAELEVSPQASDAEVDQGLPPADEPSSSRQAGGERAARIHGTVGEGKDAAHPGGLRVNTCGARHALIEWRMAMIISPSILSADFARLGEEVNAVLAAGADWIHFDVMDNHYVPNLTVGPMVCEALRKSGVKATIDVHLMVSPVDALAAEFAKAGATRISFHPEATLHVDRTIQHIRDAGMLAGTGVQSRDSAQLAGLCDRQDRSGAHHVGQSRLRRPEVHSRGARQARRGPAAHRCGGARHPSRDRRRGESGECRGDRPGGRRHVRGGFGHLRQC